MGLAGTWNMKHLLSRLTDSRLMQRFTLHVISMSALAFLVPLAVYGYTGYFTRYLADDYCFTQVVQDYSFWEAQVVFYQTTSSRYLVMLLVSLSEAFGPKAIQVLPAVNLGLLFLGFALLLFELRMTLWPKLPWLSGPLLSLASLFFLVLMAPNRLQSFYWRSGLLTYSTPLIFLLLAGALWLSCLRRRWDPWFVFPAAFGLAYLGGGASETYAALQTTIWALAFLGAALLMRGSKRKQSLLLVGTLLAGSLLAMAVLFVSPANALRQVHFPEPPGLPELARMTVTYGLAFVVDSLRTQPVPHAALLLFALFTGGALRLNTPEAPRTPVRRMLLFLAALLACTLLLVMAVVSPSAYAQSAYPEPRALVLGRFTLVMALMAGGLAAGWWLAGWRGVARGKLALAISLMGMAALSLYPVRAGWMALPEASADRQWAETWDVRDAAIRSQAAVGADVVEIRELDSRAGLLELGGDPDSWVNRCAAEYYGVSAIRASLEEMP